MNNCGGNFEFRNYTTTLEEMAGFIVPPATDPIAVLNHVVEAKQYALSCLVSSAGDAMQAVAFHYLRGKVTFVYYGKFGEPLSNFILYKDMNVLEIIRGGPASFGPENRTTGSSEMTP